jgi:phage terminase large subunit-like protein
LKNLTGDNRTWFDRLLASRTGRGDRIEVFTYWDLAFSDDAVGDPDYTVGVTVGVDRSERYFVLDVVRFRSEDVERIVEAMVTSAKEWRPKYVGIEKVAAQKLVVGLAKKEFRKRFGPKAPPVIGVGVDRGKVERARLPAGMTEPRRHPDDPARLLPGRLRFDHRAPWWPALRAELASFPSSAHDDQSDALSGAVALAQQRALRTLSRARIG